MTPQVTREELRTRLDQVVLVESLGAEYHRNAHLPGAVNLPPDRVSELAARLLPDLNAPIVVYGANANDPSALAVLRRLRELGYRRVAHYAGGKQDWAEAGLLVESDDA